MQHFFKLVALFCLLILSSSLFVEHILLVQPCILCAIQRLIFLLILITCAMGCINSRFIRSFCFFTTIVSSLIGAIIAGKQSWSQMFESFKISSCGSGLIDLVHQYGVPKLLLMAMNGKLECATIGMKIMGLSLANWSFISFTAILLYGVYIAIFD